MIRIYTLADPRTNLIFYVGASKDSDMNIAARHLGQNGYFGIRKELRLQKLRPIIETVEVANDSIEAGQLETFWIWQFRSWGFALENKRLISGYSGSSFDYMSSNWMRIEKERMKNEGDRVRRKNGQISST